MGVQGRREGELKDSSSKPSIGTWMGVISKEGQQGRKEEGGRGSWSKIREIDPAGDSTLAAVTIWSKAVEGEGKWWKAKGQTSNTIFRGYLGPRDYTRGECRHGIEKGGMDAISLARKGVLLCRVSR